VTICFKAQKTGGELRADTDASEAICLKLKDVLKLNLAFDHDKILKDAFE
jgi:8-oxo-dGTP diphosphatase